jgi:carboxylesterase type B
MSNHLVMRKSDGLYNQVIMESGAFSEVSTITMDCAEKNFQALLENTKCSDVDCLVSLSSEEINRASMKYYLISLGADCGYAPVADGVELSTHMWIKLSNGEVADVPIILGTNADEGAIFTVFPHDGTADDLNSFWSLNGYTSDEISVLNSLYVDGKTYPNEEFASKYWWAAERTWGDNIMSCPSEYTVQQFAQLQNRGRKSPTYFYHFEHTPRHSSLTRHVSEIQFVFHQSELIEHKEDSNMADVMSSYWGNFFASGNPNSRSMGSSTIPKWEPYSGENDNVFVIRGAADAASEFHLKADECAFYIPRIDASIRSRFPPQ